MDEGKPLPLTANSEKLTPHKRVHQNKHSNRNHSSTHRQGECSYSRAASVCRSNVDEVQNAVVDEAEDFEKLAIPSDFLIPVIHLYYTDDLTVA